MRGRLKTDAPRALNGETPRWKRMFREKPFRTASHHTYQSSERHLTNQQIRRLLKSSNLLQRQGSRTIASSLLRRQLCLTKRIHPASPSSSVSRTITRARINTCRISEPNAHAHRAPGRRFTNRSKNSKTRKTANPRQVVTHALDRVTRTLSFRAIRTG